MHVVYPTRAAWGGGPDKFQTRQLNKIILTTNKAYLDTAIELRSLPVRLADQSFQTSKTELSMLLCVFTNKERQQTHRPKKHTTNILSKHWIVMSLFMS